MPVSPPPEPTDDDYRIGYIAGLSLADGTFREVLEGSPSGRKGQSYWRIALIDSEPLVRIVDYLALFGVEAFIRPFQCETKRPMRTSPSMST